MELRPYQEAGAYFLAGRGRALIADDMGLGKMAQAIHATQLGESHYVLVVCPASVVENWRREFDMWWPSRQDDGVHLRVESYNKVARGDCARDNPDVLILDEAHYLKSAEAKRTKATLGKGGLVDRSGDVYALTGTPMPNHPGELWPLLKALAPETIENPKSGRPYSYWQFVHKFCKTKDNGFGIQIVGGKNHDDLKARLEPFMLRRLKSEVAGDLPPITFGQLFVEGAIEKVFGATDEAMVIEEALASDGVDGLRKVAPHVATLRRLTGLAKVRPVMDWLRDWLESCDEKIVLFAHHKEVIAQLRQHVGQLHCAVFGSMTAHQRQVQVDMFQTDPGRRVFIGQIQAAGTGITLTAASNALFVESSWVPAENSQAAMRIHRIGQTEPCLVQFATLAGSIDEQIAQAVARKTRDITKVLD